MSLDFMKTNNHSLIFLSQLTLGSESTWSAKELGHVDIFNVNEIFFYLVIKTLYPLIIVLCQCISTLVSFSKSNKIISQKEFIWDVHANLVPASISVLTVLGIFILFSSFSVKKLILSYIVNIDFLHI